MRPKPKIVSNVYYGHAYVTLMTVLIILSVVLQSDSH